MYCDDCLPAYREDHAATAFALGPQRLAERRAQGDHVPTDHPETREKIGRANAARRQEELAWEAEHGAGGDEERFRRELLPQIQGVPLRELARRSGLSLMYCSQIRRGLHVPHPRHWERLVGLVGGDLHCLQHGAADRGASKAKTGLRQ
jgi:hypothetical protein